MGLDAARTCGSHKDIVCKEATVRQERRNCGMDLLLAQKLVAAKPHLIVLSFFCKLSHCMVLCTSFPPVLRAACFLHNRTSGSAVPQTQHMF